MTTRFRRTPRAVLAGAVFGLLVAAPMSAAAHSDYSTWYRTKWKSDHHTGLNITWRFAPTFPSDSAKRDRVREGAGAWNAEGQDMKFEWLGSSSDAQPFSCSDFSALSYNGISWDSLDGSGGTWARAKVCWHTTSETYHTSHQFLIRFDSDDTWYDGTGTPGSNQVDLKSLATHEFGHATGGWLDESSGGHWSSSSSLCTDSPRHTMCPSINKGENFMRGLELHDSHTFTGLYPP